MLFHAIPPSYGYVKASHAVIRHPRLGNDAKVLITYVQGLPPGRADQALSDHAKRIGITGRAYQRAKEQLKKDGFVFEWRRQGDGGLWVTDQVVSNVPLSADEARRFRDARAESPQVGPSSHYPAVGHPGTRSAGGYLPTDEEREKNSSHPPSKAAEEFEAAGEVETAEATEAAEVAAEVVEVAERQAPDARPDAERDPEVVEAEHVLLSLRHASPQLHLGVREARSLAEAAADWLRRGVQAAELRLALVSELPSSGVRSAVGFLRYRLLQKLPEPVQSVEPVERAAEPAPVVPAPRPPITCEGRGWEHVFRPQGDETVCPPCVREAAERAHWIKWPAHAPVQDEDFEADEPLPWRERVAAILAEDAGGGVG
ncbi:hypothetical protein ACFVW8_12075 [Streptomyces sp. NPDC058221]|uniref:hypothetical protein n=1 Tax=Streptomyces sp. NPDC058221 TaxID=3346388 RepID=UPI0036EB278C